MNPFKYGQVVYDEDFCPRPKLVKEIAGFIKSGQNILIQGERRTGKTSLIYEAAHHIKKNQLLYTDLLEIKTADNLCRRLIKAIVSMEKQRGFVEKILKSISKLRPAITIDPITGQPSLSLDTSIELKPDSIESLMDMISELNRKRKIIVVLDEFQDILNIDEATQTLALLRGKIQFHSKIPYIFAGSVRNKMHDIFNNPISPFFKSAITIEVGAIDAEIFSDFLCKKFGEGKRKIGESTLKRLFEIAENIPGDIQQLCEALWETSSYRETIDDAKIPGALLLIYSRESKGYESAMVQLTAIQLKCLIGIARLGGNAPFSSSFSQGSGLFQQSTIKKSLTRLEQLKIIFKSGTEYKFINPFFKSWLISKNY